MIFDVERQQKGIFVKKLFVLLLLLAAAPTIFGQTQPAFSIGKNDLQLKNLRLGNSTYLVYFKKKPDGPAERMTLVRINVALTTVNGRKVFAITQQWESGDDVVHTSKTLHDASDLSTVFHELWWKRLGYTAIFDFAAKHVDFKGPVEESKKVQIVQDFDESFTSYNLCWHNDLIIFSLLPYKEGRRFVIKFYDPGFGKPQDAKYDVTGSESLIGSDGSRIDCWVMQHNFETSSGGNGTQRFWISKRTHEILKEEDRTPDGYRYKLKIAISGER